MTESRNPITGQITDDDDGRSIVKRPIDGSGPMEVYDSVAALDADVPTVLTFNNGSQAKMVTVTYLDATPAGAQTVKSTGERLYVGFAGTPFNDSQTPGARRVVGLGMERTFTFSKGSYCTGVSYAPAIDSLINLQNIVVEVVYI